MSKHHKLAGNVHRKIWKKHNGDIPKGYHIHHIDGNPYNNDISNLQCVSAEEHALIHASEWIKWASEASKFISSEGLRKKKEGSRNAGKKAAERKVGVHSDEEREKTRLLNSKEWRIVNIQKNLDITIKSLNRWCKENNISRSGMNCAYLDNRSYEGYYLLQIDKKETLGQKYKPKIHNNSKKHLIQKENGETIVVINLYEWCIANKISREGLRSASKKNKFYNGYMLKMTGEKPI
jgi:hypothetical protein